MNYVALDLEHMRVLFKARDIRLACLISAMDFEEVTHCIFPVERETFTPKGGVRQVKLPGFLTRMEQVMLYRNMTGHEGTVSLNAGDLMDTLHTMLCDYPVDDRSLFALEQRAGLEPLKADVADIIPNAQPIIKLPSAPSAPVAPSIPSAPTIPSAPKIPSAPRIPSAPPTAPKAGSTTGRVWAICDVALLVDGVIADMKAFRAQVIKDCEAEGINAGTAATQFGAWKRSKGL